MNTERILDQWAFSKETAFRIPQLMDELCESIVWERWERIQKKHKLKIPPPAFIRRVLTSQKEDKQLESDRQGILYDFTFSDRLQKLIRNHRTNKRVELTNFKRDIAALAEVIQALKEQWPIILNLLVVNHKLEPAIATRLQSFSEPRYHEAGEEEQFRWLSEFYALYSRLSHFGFNIGELTEIHFRNKLRYKAGCPGTLAYLLAVRNTTEPLVEGIHEVRMSGKVEDADTASERVWPFKQKPGRFVLGSDGTDRLDPTTVPKLFWAIYNVFNEFKKRKYFHQVFIPVYERSIFSLDPKEPEKRYRLSVAGAFLGWLLCDFGDAAPKDVFLDDKPPDESRWRVGYKGSRSVTDAFYNFLVGLRFLINRQFSGPYLEGEMAWALEQPINSAPTVTEFVAENTHHFGGWHCGSHVYQQAPRFSGLFTFKCSRNGTQGHLKQKGQSKVDSLNELWIDLTSRPEWEGKFDEKRIILRLRKKGDTALPAEGTKLRSYLLSVAKSVRNFYGKARLLELEQKQGRDIAAEETYEKTAHEIRKLTGHIRQESSHLDVLRHFFNIAFLSPKTPLRTIAIKLQEMFPPGFLSGATLGEFLENHFTIAIQLHPLLYAAHNSVEPGNAPAARQVLQLSSVNLKFWRRTVLDHTSLFERIGTNGDTISSTGGIDIVKTRNKIFLACALLCLFKNILEHSKEDATIKVSVIDKPMVLVFKNQAKLAPLTTPEQNRRSVGTEHSLKYYAKLYAGEHIDRVRFRDTPDEEGQFCTEIPCGDIFTS